jgi:cellulose synthase/poly-beta-1,6-N-acetylglucosamine synthase-like glycosyltransferase
MSTLAITLLVLSSLSLLVWASRHVLIIRHRRSGFRLTPDFPADDDGPLISVLVAAKDEEGCIEQCVRTMLGQEYRNFELIVVNDRSTDRTAQIVQAIAQQDARVRLMNVQHLPEGWCGKNNAMQVGIAQARGEWICMTDADCRQTSPRTLSIALAYAGQRQADLLSILPTLEMRGFWENVVQPVCGGIMMIWFHPDKVNDPARPQAYANGAFMLIRRQAYERIGTHEALKDKLNEDMHLAARVKQAGLRLHVVQNQGLYLVRMYTSLRGILRGWSRIFYGTFGTLKRLTISALVMVFVSLMPYLAAAFGLIWAAAGAQPQALLAACGLTGLAAAALQLTAIYRFYGLIGARQGMAWSYPLGCGVALAALLMSLSKLRKGSKVAWRNTTYVRSTR